jgi:hypothetical protein
MPTPQPSINTWCWQTPRDGRSDILLGFSLDTSCDINIDSTRWKHQTILTCIVDKQEKLCKRHNLIRLLIRGLSGEYPAILNISSTGGVALM